MGTIPALQPFQAPQNQVNLGDIYVQMAKMKAYQQEARLDELRIGEAQRKEAKDTLWTRLMGDIYTPEGGGAERGLAAPPPAMAPPQPAGGLATAQAGPQGASPPYAGPSSLAAMAPPVDGAIPPQGGMGMAQAPPQGPPQMPPQMPPAPSLASAQATQAPPQAPAGLAQGSGTRKVVQGLLQPINEQALVRAHQADPERTEKWFTGMMKMQGDKLKQGQERNDQIYRVLKAVDKSPNPAEAWPVAIGSLRDQGIPVPAALERFDPGMLAFKLNEHRSADVEYKEAQAMHERTQAFAAEQLGYHRIAQTKREEQAVGLDVKKDVREEKQATSTLLTQQGERERAAILEEHDTKMRPLLQQKQDLENQKTTLEMDQSKTKEERDAGKHTIDQQIKALDLEQKKIGVAPYTTDPKINTAIAEVMQGKAGAPGPADLEAARKLILAGQIEVAASHGKDAAAGAVIKEQLTNASAKGQSGEQVHVVLDDIEDLMKKGVLSSRLSESWRVYAQSAGLRPDDEAAARTWAMQNMGEQLTLAMAGGKYGGQISDPDREAIARAAGGMGKLLSPTQQKLAIQQLRRRADQDVEFANRHIKQYNETKSLPEFGQVRKERLAKTITQAQFGEALAQKGKQGWTAGPLKKFYEDQGFTVRDD